MKRTYIQTNRIEDLTILNIIEIASTIFFTSTLLFSGYLMSIQSYKYGFIGLTISAIYFTTRNALNLKLLQTIVWTVILGFAVKGAMGV